MPAARRLDLSRAGRGGITPRSTDAHSSQEDGFRFVDTEGSSRNQVEGERDGRCPRFPLTTTTTTTSKRGPSVQAA